MKIAILGAPGSGKSVVGRRLVARLNKELEGTERWSLVDDYAVKYGEKTGQPIGIQADYPGHLAILSERVMAEQEAELRGHSTVTCGTIYESLVYTAALGTFIPTDEQDRVDHYMVNGSFMTVLGYLERMTFDYDVLFFLPLPAEAASEHNWDAVVNAKIPEVLEGLFKAAIILDGTPRKNVDYAHQIVQNVRAHQVTLVASEAQ